MFQLYDFEVKVVGRVKVEIYYILQLIDSGLFSSNLFSSHFNSEKQLHQMICNCSINSGYISNLLNVPIIY